MQITEQQEEILNKFSCERLSANHANRELIRNFQSTRGYGLVQYMIKYGWDLDSNSENAFYLIKNPSGVPCLFFAIKCGAMFVPIDEEEIQRQYQECSSKLALMSNSSANNPERLALIDAMERFRQEHNMTVEDVVNYFLKMMTTTKNRQLRILETLKLDRDREGSRPIQRVQTTLPGVELTHFCTNDLAKESWKSYGFRYTMGQVLFWRFIAPKLEALQEIVGCQYLFLFAADDTPDGTLTNYYNVSLKFLKMNNVGTSKPFYDWCCEFMSQDINSLRENRKLFFDNFNLEEGTEVI